MNQMASPHQKRNLAQMVALILIIFIFCGCEKLYTSHFAEFSIKLPAGWVEVDYDTFTEDGMTTSSVLFEKKPPLIKLGKFKGARMEVSIHGTLVAEESHMMFPYLVNGFYRDTDVLSREQVEIDGLEAVRMVIKNIRSEVTETQESAFGSSAVEKIYHLKEVFYVIRNNDNRCYSIWMSTLEEDFSEFVGLFDKMAQSFQVF